MFTDFYEQPVIRDRIRDFLGDSPTHATARYLVFGDLQQPHHREPQPVEAIDLAFREGWEISRSLWDRESLVAHLDLELVNFDDPTLAYRHPDHCFETQEPVAATLQSLLAEHRIHPLHLLTGRGHHFVWRIPFNTPVFHHLEGLGQISPSLQALYDSPLPPDRCPLPTPVGTAAAGLGLVLEYLAFQLKQQAAPRSTVPVEITAVEVGPGPNGREMVSIDISEYGDPLSARTVRVPFTLYLKPWQVGGGTADLPFVLLPLDGLDWRQALTLRCHPERAAAWAASVSTTIPDASDGTSLLIEAYRHSAVARYHDWHRQPAPEMDAEHPVPGVRPGTLPACGQFILDHPNDLLLKPAGAERVTRLLLSLGWHPRQIVDLIRSRYEQDFGWGDAWNGYDPATRAEFFVRIFAGQFCTGLDDLVDFNCTSAQEERVCCVPGCRDNLARYQQSLLHRRHYERLARRPFHRLFLPEEHL